MLLLLLIIKYPLLFLLACSIAEHDMAKYVPMELLSSLSGKLCGHSDISFAKRGDTMYTQKRCNKRSTPYSQEEMARQEKFKAVSASTRARMKDPGKVMTDMEAFRAQKKYKTFYRFVFNLEWEAYEAWWLLSLENGASAYSLEFRGDEYAPTAPLPLTFNL